MTRSSPGKAVAPSKGTSPGSTPAGSGSAMPTAVNRDSGLVRTMARVTYWMRPRSDLRVRAETLPGPRTAAR